MRVGGGLFCHSCGQMPLLDKCLAKDKSRNMRVLLFSGKEGGLWEGRGKIFKVGVFLFLVSWVVFSSVVLTVF